MESDIREHLDFRKHLQAAFGSWGTASPEWLLAGQKRAMEQIDNAGLGGKLKQVRQGFSSAAERADEPLEVFIIGEGKFGKSTLINALLGEECAATDWEPKTWCFNRYIAKTSPSRMVRLYIEQDLTNYPHLRRVLSHQKGTRRGLLECHLEADEANRLLKKEEEILEQGRTTGTPYVSPVMEAEWEVGAEKALLPGLRLVDTHGFNQIHSDTAHLHYVKWQYERADAVLWLLTQERIGSAETDKELRQMSRYAKPIILVLNKWDLIMKDPDRQLQRAQDLYAGRVNTIVPFSARQAFLSVEPKNYVYSDKDRQALKKWGGTHWHDLRGLSGLDALVTTFQRAANLKNARLRSMQMYAAARQKQREYRTMFRIQRQDLEQNIEIYQKTKGEIDAKHEMMVREVNAAFDELGSQARRQFKQALPALNYENRRAVRSVLPLSQIEINGQETQRRLARSLTEHLRSIVSFAHQASNQYRDSEFNPDASIARRILFDNLGPLNIDVTKMTMSVTISLMQEDWLEKILDDVGDFFRSIFDKNRHIEIIRKRGEETRLDAEKQFEQSMNAYCRNGRYEIAMMARQKTAMLRQDLDQHINKHGGVDGARRKINAIDQAQKTIAIPPVFTEMPLSIMKRLNWMAM